MKMSSSLEINVALLQNEAKAFFPSWVGGGGGGASTSIDA